MKRPHVICHMMSTVDGKILSVNWKDEKLTDTFAGYFEKYHETFTSQAWMCGRITMERDFSGGVQPDLQPAPHPIARNAFIGDPNATSFAVAVDAHGKLGWETNQTGGDHLVEVLTEQVSDEYLYYLQRQRISYLFGGEKEVDFAVVLEQLAALFPIDTLMLEGGGHLNGSLLNAGLIDELSLLILPLADGTPQSPTTFEVSDYLPKGPATRLYLTQVQQLDNDVVWLKYQFKAA
ncbi:riboflavin biosynthesis pyrimidine reductase [Hymenobacter luteus]|uniref:Riboflavin biosynthesis pyrimidine reductase n=2 Tax=Hymenobacter TaxID=89966 RepID=A0A7W9SZG0_9BACT|nr:MULTISPECIES: RibD family protein [Hymenobacter]MBB4601207.1 riboflavin biosynthesis pyrimidine reductase [Hymenobacter latericoloratus]MBB6058586.1 riboflavin biosynthesis pyrimidine reductase [Hymenobacter luteus]